MTSTSEDVCELWNGHSVVRVPGQPCILQLVYAAELQDGGTEIFDFAEAVKRGLYSKRKDGSFKSYLAASEDSPGPKCRPNPPNLSININNRLRPRILLALALFGAVLQAGVLIFAASIQYQSTFSVGNGDPVPEYAFYILLAGILLLTAGMFLCAQIIEKSMEEVVWAPNNSFVEVIWIQQGGQTVSNQTFGSFATRKRNLNIMTSTRAPAARGLWVWLAISASLVGFVAQFIGLRATHPYVTLAQLGVTLVMIAVRFCVRLEWGSGNHMENAIGSGIEGHELDWLAKGLGQCTEWKVVAGWDNLGYLTEIDGPRSWREPAIAVMNTRAKLAQISIGWYLPDREKVKNLANAIEATMSQVFTTMDIQPGSHEASKFMWALQVVTLSEREPLYSEAGLASEVRLTLERSRNERDN